MLFNSHIFIFVFLPIVVSVYFLIARTGYKQIALLWLVCASLFFYGWWRVEYLLLITASLVFNYSVGLMLSGHKKMPWTRKQLVIFGVAANLAVLIYYKYVNFFADNINFVFHTQFHLSSVILPLGISFITFQKIAYLIDTYQKKTEEHNFIQFCLFVTFFPQLIAGPIVHHKEILSQFKKPGILKSYGHFLSVGIFMFLLGLTKKVVIADSLAPLANGVFSMASQSDPAAQLSLLEAWSGVLAYTFQLYFDFSGYSDMAIGLAYMFGIKMPINFFSPYKATSIIDFWRCWHITLSRFLKDYLYIPLGGNRKGPARQFINLLITMFLGGLWHGASWTFVIWGLLHGIYLVINHLFRALLKKFGVVTNSIIGGSIAARALTFFAVVIGWVFFRAENLTAAQRLIKAMFGANGIMLWDTYLNGLNKFSGLGDKLLAWGWRFGQPDFFDKDKCLMLIGVAIIVWGMPNAHQIMARYKPAIYTYGKEENSFPKSRYQWRPSVLWAAAASFLTIVVISFYLNKNVSEFLYFQF